MNRKWPSGHALPGALFLAGAVILGCGRGGTDLEVDRSETALARPAPVVSTPPESALASAVLQGGEEESELRGLVTFIQENDGVRVVAEVSDAEPGRYALWVHEQGLCQGPAFESAGEAFNPLGSQSRAGGEVKPQVGDLGSIEVGANGRGRSEVLTRWLTVADGLHAVDGRSVLLHALSATGVMACGVVHIQVEEETTGESGDAS